MPSKRPRSSARTKRPARARKPAAREPRFVGRDPSPVLDKYPPRESPLRGPPSLATSPGAGPARTEPPPATAAALGASASSPSPPAGLIRLERPFDFDEFSNLLGETSIRVRVPRESLPEVLRRVTDFMGFGVYVYAITVRPADSASLKEFEVELQRVDFATDRNRWEPFIERGTVDGL